jgi:predicted nucleic acid-binding protein
VVTIAYLDTSALIKQYVTEVGSEWTRTYLDSLDTEAAFLSALTTVEAACAFARRLREGTLSLLHHRRLLNAFDFDLDHRYRLLDVTPTVISLARQLAARYPVRAYDAMQLSTALLLHQDLLQSGQELLTFVCADVRLLDIARDEGLLTENPNDHP